jgi:6-pyruvoyl tetrahydropterin synthase
MYVIEVTNSFRARQGLPSPIIKAKGLPPTIGKEGFEVNLHIGIRFADTQLKQTGWFVDTDSVEGVVRECCDFLSSDVWTELFEFRPTFELVARWVFHNLKERIEGLNYVEFENKTIGVRTRYSVAH